MADINDKLGFCPRCFATTEGGSWGEVVVGDYCMNCGGGGTVVIHRWAVDSIRKQASWVGKRYYPNDEDRETARELKSLSCALSAAEDNERTLARLLRESLDMFDDGPPTDEWMARANAALRVASGESDTTPPADNEKTAVDWRRVE